MGTFDNLFNTATKPATKKANGFADIFSARGPAVPAIKSGLGINGLPLSKSPFNPNTPGNAEFNTQLDQKIPKPGMWKNFALNDIGAGFQGVGLGIQPQNMGATAGTVGGQKVPTTIANPFAVAMQTITELKPAAKKTAFNTMVAPLLAAAAQVKQQFKSGVSGYSTDSSIDLSKIGIPKVDSFSSNVRNRVDSGIPAWEAIAMETPNIVAAGMGLDAIATRASLTLGDFAQKKTSTPITFRDMQNMTTGKENLVKPEVAKAYKQATIEHPDLLGQVRKGTVEVPNAPKATVFSNFLKNAATRPISEISNIFNTFGQKVSTPSTLLLNDGKKPFSQEINSRPFAHEKPPYAKTVLDDGWKVVSDKAKFDDALINKEAATVKEMLPDVPKHYAERFKTEIDALGNSRSNPIPLKSANLDNYAGATVSEAKALAVKIQKGEPITVYRTGTGDINPGDLVTESKSRIDMLQASKAYLGEGKGVVTSKAIPIKDLSLTEGGDLIYTPVTPKTAPGTAKLQPLAQEAQKVYKGMTKGDTNNPLGSFTTDQSHAIRWAKSDGTVVERYVAPDTKFAPFQEYHDKFMQLKTEKATDAYFKGQGYDGVDFRNSPTMKGVTEKEIRVWNPEKLSTTPTNPLITEAQKYKSAEEFVKAQPTYYHGTGEKFDQIKSMRQLRAEGSSVEASNIGGNSPFIHLSEDVNTAKGYASARMVNIGGKPTVGEYKIQGSILDLTKHGSEYTPAEKQLLTNMGNKLWESSGGRGMDARIAGELKSLGKIKGEMRNADISFITLEHSDLFSQLLKDNGYGGFKFQDARITGGYIDTIAALPESVKTKSQLTDLWRKANETPKVVEPVKPVEATEFKSRVFERLQKENTSLEGDLNYNPIKLKEDAGKAVDLIAKDKQKAYDIAMGKEKSADVTSTAANIALAEKALKDGDNALYAKLITNRSLAQTRRGQELVAEKGSVTDNSTSRYVKELISAKLDKLGKGYLGDLKDTFKKSSNKEKATAKIDSEVTKLETKIRSKKLDTKTALSLLDKLTCI